MQQPDLFATDTHVTDAEQPRLGRQNAAILARLRRGRASNVELLAIAQRFGARIHDLRRHGYDVALVSRDNVRGVTWYELRGE